MRGRVLIAAGSDSGGGAGIQADVKTVTALAGFATTAITALTAQNTFGVHSIEQVDPSFVARQMEVVITDIGVDAVKTGMLHNAAVIEVVENAYRMYCNDVPLVVDPVMVAKGGAVLLQEDAVDALKTYLIPQATVLTPNIPEAEVLSGIAIRDDTDVSRAAEKILAMGSAAVLITGGHRAGEKIVDTLRTSESQEQFESPRIDTRNTHGSGCTLASAIATYLARGFSLSKSVGYARAFVHKAIVQAPGLGGGAGPLDHTHTVRTCSD